MSMTCNLGHKKSFIKGTVAQLLVRVVFRVVRTDDHASPITETESLWMHGFLNSDFCDFIRPDVTILLVDEFTEVKVSLPDKNGFVRKVLIH